jgi:hypothetical protein
MDIHYFLFYLFHILLIYNIEKKFKIVLQMYFLFFESKNYFINGNNTCMRLFM